MEIKKMSVYDNFSREDVVVFDNPSYEEAIIGETTDGRAVYDYGKMIFSLMYNEGMTEEEAVDFIDYNTIGSLGDDGRKPIVVYSFDEGYFEDAEVEPSES